MTERIISPKVNAGKLNSSQWSILKPSQTPAPIMTIISIAKLEYRMKLSICFFGFCELF